jgi:hypothetical protein
MRAMVGQLLVGPDAPMTKPSKQNFEFDRPVEKQDPRLGLSLGFLLPVLLIAAGVAVAHFWL